MEAKNLTPNKTEKFVADQMALDAGVGAHPQSFYGRRPKTTTRPRKSSRLGRNKVRQINISRILESRIKVLRYIYQQKGPRTAKLTIG